MNVSISVSSVRIGATKMVIVTRSNFLMVNIANTNQCNQNVGSYRMSIVFLLLSRLTKMVVAITVSAVNNAHIGAANMMAATGCRFCCEFVSYWCCQNGGGHKTYEH